MKEKQESYTEEEAKARFEQALKSALKTPHKPHGAKLKSGTNQCLKAGKANLPKKIKGS